MPHRAEEDDGIAGLAEHALAAIEEAVAFIRIAQFALASGHIRRGTGFLGEGIEHDRRLGIQRKARIDPHRMRRRRMEVPIGVIDVRLLSRPAGKDAVGGDRAHDEFTSDERTQHRHEYGMRGHPREDVALGEQVPHAALQGDPAAALGIALEVGDLATESVLVRLAHDDVPRLGDFVRREQTPQRHRATAVEQFARDGVGVDVVRAVYGNGDATGTLERCSLGDRVHAELLPEGRRKARRRCLRANARPNCKRLQTAPQHT